MFFISPRSSIIIFIDNFTASFCQRANTQTRPHTCQVHKRRGACFCCFFFFKPWAWRRQRVCFRAKVCQSHLNVNGIKAVESGLRAGRRHNTRGSPHFLHDFSISATSSASSAPPPVPRPHLALIEAN